MHLLQLSTPCQRVHQLRVGPERSRYPSLPHRRHHRRGRFRVPRDCTRRQRRIEAQHIWRRACVEHTAQDRQGLIEVTLGPKDPEALVETLEVRRERIEVVGGERTPAANGSEPALTEQC